MSQYIGFPRYAGFGGAITCEKRVVFAAGTAALALADAEVAAGRADQRVDLTGVTVGSFAFTPDVGFVWAQFASYSVSLDDGSGTSQPQITMEYDLPMWGGTLLESHQGNFSQDANEGISGTTSYMPLTDGVTPFTIYVSLATPFTTGIAYAVATFYKR